MTTFCSSFPVCTIALYKKILCLSIHKEIIQHSSPPVTTMLSVCSPLGSYSFWRDRSSNWIPQKPSGKFCFSSSWRQCSCHQAIGKFLYLSKAMTRCPSQKCIFPIRWGSTQFRLLNPASSSHTTTRTDSDIRSGNAFVSWDHREISKWEWEKSHEFFSFKEQTCLYSNQKHSHKLLHLWLNYIILVHPLRSLAVFFLL